MEMYENWSCSDWIREAAVTAKKSVEQNKLLRGDDSTHAKKD
jgi:hypothetical protein